MRKSFLTYCGSVWTAPELVGKFKYRLEEERI